MMKKVHRIIFTFLAASLFVVLPNISRAEETAETKAAAIEYEKAVPTFETVELAVMAFAKNPQTAMSDEEVKAVLDNVKSSKELENLQRTNIDSMAKNFTVEEIKAMQDFYGSAAGKSAQRKLSSYVQEFFPQLNALVMKSIIEIKGGGAASVDPVTPGVP